MAITYKDAGVDTIQGQSFVQAIKQHAKKTMSPAVISGIGGFAALFVPDWQDYSEPVLVSGTDGVGTKLEIAQELNKHDTIGQDLVAMCLNDILTIGARPLFFLDYLMTDKLQNDIHVPVVAGIAAACQASQMALIGGETAEHPGKPKGYDLAGFAVGIVDRKKMLPRTDIKTGDILLGLPSSGVHSNGFSLVRRIIHDQKLNLLEKYNFEKSLGEILLEPTRLYHAELLPLAEKNLIKGAAHITGGGFYENIPRIFPEGVGAVIDLQKIPILPIFRFLSQKGPVAMREMFSTFNMGIGMVLVAAPEDIVAIQKLVPASIEIGYLQSIQHTEPVKILGID